MDNIEETYIEALRNNLIENMPRLNFWEGVINISNGVFIGSVCATAFTMVASPDNSVVASSAFSALALIANLIAHLRKKAIIKEVAKKAEFEVEKQLAMDLMKEIFPFIDDDMVMSFPFGFAVAVTPSEENVPDGDLFALEEAGNLLTSYAEEVAYPDYEQDISFIEDVINGYKNGMISIEEAHENITSIESTMLDKAYHFYTEDFGR